MDLKVTKQLMPLDYVKIFFRRKWFIIIPTVAGIIISIIAGNILPKKFEASTLILVEEGRIINPLIQGIAVSTSTAQRLAVLREQILGWDRLIQLIKSLDLAKGIRTQSQFENLVKELRKNINVRLRGASIISISYEGGNPAEAQNIVKTITDIFISENLRQQNKETEDAVSFINDQLALYQKKIKQTEVAKMEDELKKLLIDSTPKHPLVIELKAKIELAKREMSNGNYNVEAAAMANSEKELKELREELKKAQADPSAVTSDVPADGTNRMKMTANSNEKVYKLLLLERLDKVEAKDADVTQKLYNELLNRLETAKITQRLEASKEGTRYTILDPARVPLKPKWPNKLVLLAMGLFFGFGAGTGMVFLVELFDHSFMSVEEAKAFIDIPVFGAVSKIITKADVAAQNLRNRRITRASIATGVVLLIIIIFNVVLGS
ncbi:MAG: GNVR domain-containing protein [Candidatus Omnitrophota bacterium]